jgi:HD-like signal output (HDOD) protein
MLPKGAAQQDAITAGLLHDIGQLVLIADDCGWWRRVTEQAQIRQMPIHRIEQEDDGITHAAIGGYLLRLWGLPDNVAEAVAHHHDPLAVPGAALDAAYLDQLGAQSQLDRWRELARSASDAAPVAAGGA